TPGRRRTPPPRITTRRSDPPQKTPPITTPAATPGSPKVISLAPASMQTKRGGLAAIIQIEPTSMRKQMPALGAVTAIALTAAMVWQSRSWRVAMTLGLVPVALLLGTSSALAFDTSKLIQFGTLPLDDLTPVIAKSARLQQEINQALSEGNKEHRVVCLGMRFPGPWKNLGGLRVSPYTCDFGAKWLQI